MRPFGCGWRGAAGLHREPFLLFISSAVQKTIESYNPIAASAGLHYMVKSGDDFYYNQWEEQVSEFVRLEKIFFDDMEECVQVRRCFRRWDARCVNVC